jgi:hypothetical protein
MSSSPPPRTASARPEDQNGQVELQEIETDKPKLPIEEDLMQLARLGELRAIQKLFDSGKFSATSTDEQGITPLHVRSPGAGDFS